MQLLERSDQGTIHVVVADNTRMHSQLLSDAMKRDRRIHVVASVSTTRELLDSTAKLPLGVAVISSNLDGEPSGGFEVMRELRTLRPAVRGVMLLDSSKAEAVVKAFRAGAKGVFSKNEPLKSLCKCIRCVYEDQIWANSKEITFVLDALATTPAIRAVNADGINLLSRRELEVVHCLAEGLTNHEIGQRLGLSKHTIKNYLLRIFDKVGVSNRMELLFLTLSQPATTREHAGQHESAAPDWYTRPAEQGLPAAQFRLVQNYKDGIGLARDTISAYMWCLLSERSNVGVIDQITIAKKELAESMTTEQILEAERKAAAWPKEPKRPSLFAVPGGRDGQAEVMKKVSSV